MTTMVPEGTDEHHVALTLGRLLDRAAEQFPLLEALVTDHDRLDYRTFHRRADAFARGLLRIGVRQGDRVIVWIPNCIEWVIAFFAIAKIGAITVTCNTRYKSLESEHLLRNSEASTLIMSADFPAARINFLQILKDAAPQFFGLPGNNGEALRDAFPDMRNIVLLDGEIPDDLVIPAHDFNALERDGSGATPLLHETTVMPDDIAQIIYTSGTTGAPKGCMLSHRTLSIRARQRVGMFPWQPDERFLVTMPYSHIAGTVGPIVGSVLMGSCQVIMSMFDAAQAMRLIERENITFMSGVPTMFRNILNHPEFSAFKLRSLRTVTLGSADIPADLIHRLKDQDGLGLTTLVMYGMTETGGSTHCSRLDDSVEVLATTAGTVVQGLEDRIVNVNTGLDCPAGEVGEIWVRGPGMMSGYYNMPDATAARFKDGWLRTGDLGAKDETGHLRITGRISDVILVGGFNTYPAEIEHLLMRHPEILEAAVIGVPDAVMGEVVMAFVVPQPGHDIGPVQVRDFLRSRIANFKVPRFVRIVETLPLTASGKVQKHKLKESLDMESLQNFAVT